LKDRLTKLLIENQVSVTAADTTHLVEYARVLHDTWPVATAALGRALTAAVMMGSQLKHDRHSLTLNINGGGPAGTLIATAKGGGAVKGCMGNPHVDLPGRADGKLDVGGAVGREGFLTVIRDVGLKDAYVGRTELRSGEIAEDLAYYFLQSEQQPSLVFLGVRVDTDASVQKAGGIIISPLPGTSEDVLAAIETKVAAIGEYTLLLLSKSPSEAVTAIFEGMEVRELDTLEPRYVCDCSEERLEQVIISLGREEISDMIQKDGQAEIVCRFCNKKMIFSAERLEKLLREASE